MGDVDNPPMPMVGHATWISPAIGSCETNVDLFSLFCLHVFTAAMLFPFTLYTATVKALFAFMLDIATSQVPSRLHTARALFAG